MLVGPAGATGVLVRVLDDPVGVRVLFAGAEVVVGAGVAPPVVDGVPVPVAWVASLGLAEPDAPPATGPPAPTTGVDGL